MVLKDSAKDSRDQWVIRFPDDAVTKEVGACQVGERKVLTKARQQHLVGHHGPTDHHLGQALHLLVQHLKHDCPSFRRPVSGIVAKSSGEGALDDTAVQVLPLLFSTGDIRSLDFLVSAVDLIGFWWFLISVILIFALLLPFFLHVPVAFDVVRGSVKKGTPGSNNLKGGQKMKRSEMAYQPIVSQNNATILVQPRKRMLHHDAGAILLATGWLSFFRDAVHQAVISQRISATRRIVALVAKQVGPSNVKKFVHLLKHMGQSLAVVFVAWVKEQVQWRPHTVSNGRHLGCFPTPIYWGPAETVASPDIFDERRVDHDVFGNSSAATKVEAQDVQKGAFEDVLLGPVGEIVIDGLPRAVFDWDIGPLASGAKNVGDALENIADIQLSGTARA